MAKVKGGKRIDKFTVFIDGVAGRYEVELFHVVTEYSRHTCVAICEDPHVHIEDPNIALVREKVKAEIRRLVQIEWEPRIRFRVADLRDGFGIGRRSNRIALDVTVDAYETAMVNGKRFEREPGSSHSHEASGRYRGEDETLADVKDTPEVRAAVDALVAGFEKMHAELASFLSKERIEATIAHLSSGAMPALPLPRAPLLEAETSPRIPARRRR